MRYELHIDGMVAVHARQAVFMALAAVEGVAHAEVELGRAVVTFAARAGDADDGGVAAEPARERALRTAIADAGFRVRSVARLRSLPTL